MDSKVTSLFVPVLVLSSLQGGSQAHAQTTPLADAMITGESGDDLFGWHVAPAGDVNGDGAPDLIVGAPSNDAVADFAGRAYLFHGPITGNLNAANADAIVSAEAFGDNLGFSVASAGDVNADGFDDVLIGARGNDTPGIQAGRVYLFLGPISGHRPATSANAIISGAAFDEVGRVVAHAGDLNGDGFDDILLGTDLGGPADEGQAFVFYGPISGQRPVSSADAIINGTFANESLGFSVAVAGDVNGDGIPDIVVGAPHFPLGSNGTGRAYVFYGPITGVISAASANAILFGEGLNDSFGTSVAAGDVNGDSVSDVVVGADQIFLTNGTGKAYVFYGPLSGPIQAANANAILLGETADALFGTSVAAGDVNGDGFDDTIAGAWDQAGGGFRSGRAYVFHGPLSGTIPAANADFIVTGSAGDRVGLSVAAGDVNDDGVSDTLVGAPQFTDGAPGYAAVFAQSVPVAPFALAVDTAGNSVFQPNETVIMAPTWRNTGTAAITLDGTTSNFTGPAGAIYTNADSTASYGIIGVSAQGNCSTTGNCYSVLAIAATRPLTHWDTSVTETVNPSATTKDWTLHIGASFTDVTASNGFYRFIETILHKNVTGGCTTTTYCPGNSTTRGQMAVFVLVSKGPAAFTPPPCVAGSEMFADVPASSPFCRWVEELARRGVVSGCGGGNYCPSSSTTREQMAVVVLRTLDSALDPPACTAPVFADVPASSGSCRWIEELFRRGVVTGCGGGNYCPTADVSREQMSVFLAVTFGLTLYGL